MTRADLGTRDWHTQNHELLVEAISLGVLYQAADGRIMAANPAAERILGLTFDRMRGRTFWDAEWHAIYADGTEVPGAKHPAAVAAQTGQASHDMLMGLFNPRTGETTWILVSAIPLIPPGETGTSPVYITLEDITERKRTEIALRQALERQKELSELKSRFVAMASHELRTPLATILATTETLLAYRQRMEPEQIDRRLDKIREQINHLRMIIDDVLQLSHIESGRYQFNPEESDLDALCREICDAFQSRADASHRLQYTCAYAPVIARLDQGLMRQVITQLIAYANMNAPAGTTVSVHLDKTDDSVVLCVRDEGMGMAEADLKHLFEPFFRGARADRTRETGLGLAIAREAVALHGGSITVESQPGAGATICVHIPRTAKDEADHDQDPRD